jgi:DNA polymerase-3 subunit alpha
MEYYEFDCGCKFKVLDSKVNKDGFPTMEYDFYNLRNCQKVWDLLATGSTKGVFQLESQHGQSWCEKFKPNSIDEIAILTSILRPGSTEAMLEGKNITQHFVDRKHGLEECKPMHSALGDILKETYNLGCFQEQSIQIVKDIAGFDEGTAEIFRKAVGKKDVKKMAKLKPKFIQGCIDNGLTEKDGEDIFSILEASERYGFNRCLSPETLVEREDGEYISIKDIDLGDKINSPDGFVEVVNKYDNGEKELFCITLESGKEIECTLDHKFLCEDGIVRPLYEIISENYMIVSDNNV